MSPSFNVVVPTTPYSPDGGASLELSGLMTPSLVGCCLLSIGMGERDDCVVLVITLLPRIVGTGVARADGEASVDGIGVGVIGDAVSRLNGVVSLSSSELIDMSVEDIGVASLSVG